MVVVHVLTGPRVHILVWSLYSACWAWLRYSCGVLSGCIFGLCWSHLIIAELPTLHPFSYDVHTHDWPCLVIACVPGTLDSRAARLREEMPAGFSLYWLLQGLALYVSPHLQARWAEPIVCSWTCRGFVVVINVLYPFFNSVNTCLTLKNWPFIIWKDALKYVVSIACDLP